MQYTGVTSTVVSSEINTLRRSPWEMYLYYNFCQLWFLYSSKYNFVWLFVVRAIISLAIDSLSMDLSETFLDTSTFSNFSFMNMSSYGLNLVLYSMLTLWNSILKFSSWITSISWSVWLRKISWGILEFVYSKANSYGLLFQMLIDDLNVFSWGGLFGFI